MPDLSQQEIADLVRDAGSVNAAAKRLGIARSTLWHRLHGATPSKAAKLPGSVVDPAPPASDETFSHDESSDAATITSRSSTIRTLDDALRSAKVDTTIWEVERHVVNKWDVARGTKGDQWDALELWQVKVWLRRRIAKATEDTIAALIRRMAAHAPKYPRLARAKPSGEPVMAEVSINDAHFGKLAWSRETGNDYDLKIAEAVYEHAMDELLEHVAPRNVAQWLVPLGNDFFHIDNATNSTTAGTPQDVDGRLTKIYTTGKMAVIRAVDRMLGTGPVKIVLVPGNHDRLMSWHLAHDLKGWYRHCPDVEVDDEPKPRKYVEYGKSLLGFTHGNEEKHSRLPNLMATEMPAAWARTKFREWRLGHFHIRKQTEYVSVDTHEGTVIRVLPSLSGTDAWHFSKGYVGVRAADAFLWSKDRGCIGSWSSNVA